MKDWSTGERRFSSQIGNWDKKELAVMMNRGKAGRRPYAYQESLVRMVTYSVLYLSLSYRQNMSRR